MLVSQKCQYALRAVFELARRNGKDGGYTLIRLRDAMADVYDNTTFQDLVDEQKRKK